MNWDRIEGNWKQVKGSVKVRWGKLTDDQLDIIAGKRDELAGRIPWASLAPLFPPVADV